MKFVEEYHLVYKAFYERTALDDFDNEEFNDRSRTVTVRFESGYLPDVLAEIQAFLESAGFGYIENLVALSYDSMTGEVMEHAASHA